MRRFATASLVLLASPLLCFPSAFADTITEIFRKQSPSIVLIAVFDSRDELLSFGSGFVVDSNGTVVTNYHVIEDAPRIVVKLPSGQILRNAALLYKEKDRDLAILSVKGYRLPQVRLGDSDRLEIGEEVIAIGNPQGLENTVTKGIVSGRRNIQGKEYIQTDTPISGGSSGGPLLNMKGEVIGVTVFALRESQNLNFAIPINDVKRALRRMTAESSVDHQRERQRAEAELAKERQERQRAEAELLREREARQRAEEALARERETRQRADAEVARESRETRQRAAPAIAPSAQRPSYQPGFWFRTQHSNRPTPSTYRFEGIQSCPVGECLVSSSETGELALYTKDFALVEIKRPDGARRRFFPPFSRFQWPLRVRAVWNEHITVEDFSGETRKIFLQGEVVAYEEVNVRAGSFIAFKIRIYIDGKLFQEFWYSPQAQVVVRSIQYDTLVSSELAPIRK